MLYTYTMQKPIGRMVALWNGVVSWQAFLSLMCLMSSKLFTLIFSWITPFCDHYFFLDTRLICLFLFLFVCFFFLGILLPVLFVKWCCKHWHSSPQRRQSWILCDHRQKVSCIWGDVYTVIGSPRRWRKALALF